MIESLESRVCLSVGPIITSINVVGSPKAVTSVVIGFNEPLNPATAQNVSAYSLGKPPVVHTSSGTDIPWGSIFGFRYPMQHEAAGHRPKLVRNGKIQMASAVYDATANTVTLTPLAPFKAQHYFRYFRVKGTGVNAIQDTSGIPLDGGVDIVARWNVHQGRTIHYKDPVHDHVTLKLKGPGKLMVFTLGSSKDANAVIFVEGGTAATTLSGSVKNTTEIFPSVHIAEIEGANGITDNLLTSKVFNTSA